VGHDAPVGVGGGDLLKVSSLPRRTALAWHRRSERLQAPTYWMLMATVEAPVPLSKSWLDHAAAAPAVSTAEATTPPW